MNQLALTSTQVVISVMLLLTSSHSLTDVYKTVDKDGKVIYTDNPEAKDKAVEVELPHINTQPATKVEDRPQSTAKPLVEGTHYTITLTRPASGLVVTPGQRDLKVSALVNPKLKRNHRLQLLLNGKPYGRPSKKSSITIKEIFRGEHRLEMAVVGPKGEVLSKSEPTVVSVIRPTVAKPKAKPKG